MLIFLILIVIIINWVLLRSLLEQYHFAASQHKASYSFQLPETAEKIDT